MTLSGGKMPNARRPRTRDVAPTNVDGLTLVHAILQAGRELRQRLATVGHPRHLKDSELLLLWACSRPATDGFSEASLAGPLGLSGGELSGMLYDLRDRGLMGFSRVPDGETPQHIELTAEGQAVLSESVTAFNVVVEDWVRSFPPLMFAATPSGATRKALAAYAQPRATAAARTRSAVRPAAVAPGSVTTRITPQRPRGKRGAA